jgi:hypothetical protein
VTIPKKPIQVPAPPYSTFNTSSSLTINSNELKEILAWYCSIYKINVSPKEIALQQDSNYQFSAKITFNNKFELPVVVAEVPKTLEDARLPEIDIS